MNIYITRINGLPLEDTLQCKQDMVAEIAYQLGCKEMAIYRYYADNESTDSRNGRLDGIIAGIRAGDIVICQFPTGNGVKFEWDLVTRLKAYRSRIAIFISDIKTLIDKGKQLIQSDILNLYNQAEVLIVPSYAMRQFLMGNGIKKDMKFIVQEMWDYVIERQTFATPEYKKEIHNPDELSFELAKGGFGLVWYKDEKQRNYMEYDISFSLSKYLAAGIPVIVPVGISNQILIEENHLGIVAASLEEAEKTVETMGEEQYEKYIQDVEKAAPAIRKGYYLKKCLIETMQAFYRKDAGRIFMPNKIYSIEEYGFESTVLNKSYGDNLALSWNFRGKPDGFFVCDRSGKELYNIRGMYQHYLLIKNHKAEDEFIVKAYVDTLKGKLVVAQSKPAYIKEMIYGFPKVSVIIPAYNADKHIARSIDTALGQSFLNLEIIVVDDGSTDRTSSIIDWYAEQYNNLVVIHQRNLGVAAARNAGIMSAKGDYIAFLDSDDMFRPDMINRLYYTIEKNCCDIAITSAYQMTDIGYEEVIQYPMLEDVAVGIDEFFLDYYLKECGFGEVIWNKLYRTPLVKAHLLPEIYAEDAAWTPCILSYANNVCYLNGCAYEYNRLLGGDSLSDKVRKKPKEEQLKVYKNVVMFYLKNCNIEKLYLMKVLAKKKLIEKARAYSCVEYEKLWQDIEKTF